MSKGYDAIVIGGGPAGTASACFLRKKYSSVLLLEKSFFPRDKVCGEFISPAAWRFFDPLGVRSQIEHSGYHPIQGAAFYADGARKVHVPFISNHGLGLSRQALDLILLNHAKSQNVEVREGILATDYRKSENRNWKIKSFSKKDKSPEIFETPNLIVASGRHFSNPQKGKKMIGLKAHYQGVKDLGSILELYFLKEGYGGLVQIESGLVNACFLMDMDQISAGLIPKSPDKVMKNIFDRHPRLKDQMSLAVRVSPLQTTGPLVLGLKSPPRLKGLFHVGDALGVIDPFLGEGMTIALESAQILFNAHDGQDFDRKARRALRNRFFISRCFRGINSRSYLMKTVFYFLSRHESWAQKLFQLAHGYTE